ncbi:MAG: DUF531 family protein [bacterium]
MPGRLTLGLYNCYDPKQWYDIMRVTLARAGPVALAFDADVATFGFPFLQARRRGSMRSEALRTAHEVADFVASGTSIGEGGEYVRTIVEANRLHILPFGGERDAGPRALGRLVAATPQPDPEKACTPLEVAKLLAAGEPQMVLFGLGPRGLPQEVLDAAPRHLEITGKGISMETSTALGALPAMISAHLQHLKA